MGKGAKPSDINIPNAPSPVLVNNLYRYFNESRVAWRNTLESTLVKFLAEPNFAITCLDNAGGGNVWFSSAENDIWEKPTLIQLRLENLLKQWAMSKIFNGLGMFASFFPLHLALKKFTCMEMKQLHVEERSSENYPNGIGFDGQIYTTVQNFWNNGQTNLYAYPVVYDGKINGNRYVNSLNLLSRVIKYLSPKNTEEVRLLQKITLPLPKVINGIWIGRE